MQGIRVGAWLAGVCLLAGVLTGCAQAVGPTSTEQGAATAARQEVARTSPPTKVYARCGYRPPQVRPRKILLACADGSAWYRHLRWDSWGRSTATGHGILWANDCKPYCAKGTFHSYPLRLTLGHVWRTHGHRVFHRSAYVFTASKKPGWLPRHGHLPLPTAPYR